MKPSSAQQVEGTVRNAGIHAAGVINSGDIMQYIPVCTS
jgi:DNA polymerase III alpha subunit